MSRLSADNHMVSNRPCGLYVHIPFCLKKCPYCNFFSITGHSGLYDRYARAAVLQLHDFAGLSWTKQHTVDTIFFGGGTPSVLPVSQLVMILDACLSRFPATENMEISLEANPATVSPESLEQLVQAGFNRISIGAQSLAEQDIHVLGRPHSAGDVINTVQWAGKAGFANVSLDLMYGLPGQTVFGWRDVLLRALSLEPDHLSIYELTVEPDTVFARLQQQGQLDLPREDEVLMMMEHTLSETVKRGYTRYEISNYARIGKECRHNINYWHNGSYIGVGAGAVSCLSGSRSRAVEDVASYCQKIESGREPWVEREELDQEGRFRETVIMGLRMTEGISITNLQDRFCIDLLSYYGSTLSRLRGEGLVTLDNDRLRLSPAGLLVANSVMAELV